MLCNRWLKDYLQTAENYQILYSKFHVLFKSNQRKIATNFLSTLVLWLALETFVCLKRNGKYLNTLQYYPKGCYANTLNSKERSISLLTVSHQRNTIKFLTYFLGQQNNIVTMLSRALPQRYVADFEHVQT